VGPLCREWGRVLGLHSSDLLSALVARYQILASTLSAMLTRLARLQPNALLRS
jgi:hypothetical protein